MLLRPIVTMTTIQSPAYHLSRFLATILEEIVHPTHFQTEEFSSIRSPHPKEEHIVIPFDFVNCFGNSYFIAIFSRMCVNAYNASVFIEIMEGNSSGRTSGGSTNKSLIYFHVFTRKIRQENVRS